MSHCPILVIHLFIYLYEKHSHNITQPPSWALRAHSFAAVNFSIINGGCVNMALLISTSETLSHDFCAGRCVYGPQTIVHPSCLSA